MRSPWQVLKSFASRSKADEEQAPAGKALRPPQELDATPVDQLALAVDPAARPQSEPSPVEKAEAPSSRQTEPTPSETVPNARASEHDAPAEDVGVPDETSRSSAAPAKPAVGGSDAPANSIAKTQRPARIDPKGRARPVAPRAVDVPRVQSEPTAVERASALDDEIEELRSKLSAKLREQNNQIRMLLDRYGNH